MEIINQKSFSGERALYGVKNLRVEDSVFENGESPFKEASNIELDTAFSDGNILSGIAMM